MTLLQFLCTKLEKQIKQHEEQVNPDRDTLKELKKVYGSFARMQAKLNQ